ncbi:hypothetical protein I316_01328 [Kwoniella heveanensis BCC8398]|uniref:Uncharacterized protein n=1 Tax=Kwoniella heveanensis BCC8398 TaxID=1296120 RepID=A0A1B9H0D2_9TREE|nr:hypothetical protein I316_01328 [Kwoniella heveanensis BCC8398]
MAERQQSSATAVSSEAEEGGTGSNIDTGTYTAEGGGSSPSDSGHGSLGSFKFTYTASDGRGRMNKREDSVSIRWTDHTGSIGGGRRYTIDRTGNEEGSFISISGLTLDEVKRHYEGNGGYTGAAARRIIDFEKQSGHSQGARPISTSSPGRSSAG